MTFLRSWLLSVTACAVLVSIVQQLTDGGAMKKIVRFNVTLSGAVNAEFESGFSDYISRRCFAELKRRYSL